MRATTTRPCPRMSMAELASKEGADLLFSPLKQEVLMETIIDGSTLEAFRGGLRGTAYAPGEEGYDEARMAWNLNAHQHPSLAVMTDGPADVISAVRLARDEGLGVGVMATGHGVAYPCDGGILIT